jgi:hypothetical protein
MGSSQMGSVMCGGYGVLQGYDAFVRCPEFGLVLYLFGIILVGAKLSNV